MTVDSDPTIRWILALIGGCPTDSSSVDWARAVELLRVHGLQGLAVAEGRSGLPAELRTELESEYLRIGLRSTLVVEALRRARACLGRSGISSLSFKGGALLESGTYADPGARYLEDGDLLVRPSDAEEAMSRLQEVGFRPWAPWNPSRTGWLDSATLTDTSTPDGMDIALDLHWRIGYGGLRYGDDRGDGINGPPSLWEGADVQRGIPRPEEHLVVVLQHVLKHLHVLLHLRGLADVARLSERVQDWDRVWTLTAEGPAGHGVRHLLDCLRDEAGVKIPPESSRPERSRADSEGWLASWIDRPSLAEMIGESTSGPGRLRGLLRRWRVLGSSTALLGETRDVLWPSREWLDHRYPELGVDGGSARLRYLGDVARWLVGGPSPVSPNQDLGE